MDKLKFSQFGVMSVNYQLYSLEYALASIAKAGFRYVDLWGGAPHYSYSKRYYLPFIPSLDRSPLSEEPETYSRGRYCCACRAIYLLLRVKDNSENA